MGNEADFHFGRKRPESGLEFVASAKRKRPSFRQAAAHFEGRSGQPDDQLGGAPQAPRLQAQQLQAPLQEPQAAPAQETTAYEVATEDAINVHLAAAAAHRAPVNQQPVPDRSQDIPMTLAEPLDNIYQEPMLTPSVAPQEAAGAAFNPETHNISGIEDEWTAAPLQASLTAAVPAEQDSLIDLYDTTAPLKTSKTRKIVSYVIAFVALVILILSVLFIHRNASSITPSIRKKAQFTLYEMAPNTTFKLNKKSVQLSEQGNLVFFADNPATKAHYVVSEQKIPDVIKADADYQQFLSDSDKFADVTSSIGKAYFTRPQGIGTDISVVVKTANTLLFIRGPGTTSDSDWSTF